MLDWHTTRIALSMAIGNPSQQSPFNKLFFFIILFWLVIWSMELMKVRSRVQSINYSQFLTELEKKKIERVEIRDSVITGTFKDPPKGSAQVFTTNRMHDPELVNRLKESDAQFTEVPENPFARFLFSWIIPGVILFLLFQFLLGRFGAGSQGGFVSLGKAKTKIYVERELKTRFDDVAGVDEAKLELKEVVNFLKNPTHFTRLGGRMPKGILLVGPPGTGKTLLARAVAGEAGVPFFSINGSEFVELFVGLGAARVRDLFVQARAQAPCIIFIDELDALGKARGLSAISGSANDEKEQTLNQLLAELDGFDPSQGVILIAATNRPEVLDPALLRAGRFDRQLLLDKPDRKGREQILSVHLRNIKVSPEVTAAFLASLTTGFSGADLANLVNEAALIAVRSSKEAVGMKDFTEAIERHVAGLERPNRILNAEEKRRVAYHEMGHAVLALALGQGEVVHKVSIIPRGIGALGYTFRRPTEDRYLMSRPELNQKMAIALGGKASESIFFKDASTGAADDLDKATEIARAMVTRYGMSEALGLATYERDPSPFLASQFPQKRFDYSEATAKVIDHEIENLLRQAYDKAIYIVTRYRSFIESGVSHLMERETLEEAELAALWKKYEVMPVLQQDSTAAA